MNATFSPSHRGGSGSPMVCLHGFTDTWRTWELVLAELEREHDVLAPTLTGHAGGPPLEGEISHETLADAVEAAMDEAGFETAHIVGNSLGGYVAVQLAARGRARTVVALAPAGGWAEGDASFEDTLQFFRTMQELVVAAAPQAEAILATPEGRRRATEFSVTNFEHIPTELLVHQLWGAASCDGFFPLIEHAVDRGLEHRRRADHLSGPRRLGNRRQDPARGRPRRSATARNGRRAPTGSSSTGSATCPNSMCRSRPPS